MSNQSVSIRLIVRTDPALRAVVKEAARCTAPYVGFYWSAGWAYWTAEAAEATASNCYYTPGECAALLK